MATAAPPRYTPEDLLRIDDRPMPELVDGQLVEREPMGLESDVIGVRLIAALVTYSSSVLPGMVTGASGGFQIFPEDRNKVRIPDVSFTRLDRVPGGRPPRGHGRFVPDLVVEILSPNDLAEKVELKVEEYRGAGVPLILVINPPSRTVRVIRGDGTGVILGEGDTLDGGEVLPGFNCPVASLFAFV